MEATKFSRNHTDVSRSAQEVDAGFQFDFLLRSLPRHLA